MKNAARERRLTLMTMICASSSSLAFQVLLFQVTMAKKDAESDYLGPACEQFELSRRLLCNCTATDNPTELYRLDRHPAITNKSKMSVKLRTERRRLSREKQRRSSLEESATFSEAGYESRVQQLSAEARDLDDKLCMALSELEPLPFETKLDVKYRDEVRLCCYSLLSKNVGVWNVGPVIRAVTVCH